MKVILKNILVDFVNSLSIWLLCGTFLSVCAQPSGSQTSSMLNVNYNKLASRADLHYDTLVERSEAGMPVGNGRMGSLVWTTPDMLRFQLNRVDLFANTSASNNFFQRNTSYNGGLGFVDIDFADFNNEVFMGNQFEQHLSVYNGEVTVKGKGVEARVTAWDQQDVMVVHIQDRRENPTSIKINLRMLRSPTVERGNHTAISEVKKEDGKIILTQKFTEDEYYSGSSVVIDVAGRKAKARITNESEVQLTIAPGKGAFSVFMGSSVSFQQNEDLVASAAEKVYQAKSQGFSGVSKFTKDRWHNFWKKGFVYLNSDDGKAESIEKNYTYYLYVMASSSRGAYPPKFNGMIWNTGGDARQWGSAYWGANQSCLYNALFPTNRIELMDPMFNRYTKARHSFEIAAQQQWDSQGIFIPETMTFNGLPELPIDVAEEFRDLYLLRKPWEERSKEFESYASTKMPFLSRWNWKSDRGWENGKWQYTNKDAGPFGHVTHIFSRGAKIAYQFWLKYEYLQKEMLAS